MHFTGFNELAMPLANQIKVNGDPYLYFGGTAYLGIPQSEEFLNLYFKGLKNFGLNNGTSRGNNVQLGIYDEAEKFAANKFGSASALITSSGYLAAQLTVKNLSSFGEIRYAPKTHPALWINDDPKIDGSFTNWTINIVNEINNSVSENWVIITNSMNNFYPEIYNFSFLNKLQKKVTLVVDDSHGIGINNNGLSALSAIPYCENVETIIIASMAKALGVDAGLILGSEKIICQLKQSNEFIGASPPAAAGLYAFINANPIYKKEHTKLMEITADLGNFLKGKNNWHFIPNFPVFFCKDADLSAKLLAQNILVSSFPYPDKDGPIINRIVLCSWHTNNNIQLLKNNI